MKRIRILIFGNNGFKWQPMIIDRSEWLVGSERPDCLPVLQSSSSKELDPVIPRTLDKHGALHKTPMSVMVTFEKKSIIVWTYLHNRQHVEWSLSVFINNY